MEIGGKLRALRLQRGLTQEEMADRCELSKGFISQVERDQASPSIATLKDMLECLGSDLKTFFKDDAPEREAFRPSDMFVKEDLELLKGDITWLVPSAQKNSMEPILMTLGPGGRSEELPPHEGEEFGYVLQGAVTLRIGARKIKLRAGDSFCAHPTQAHWAENAGKRTAKLIWVSTPPSF